MYIVTWTYFKHEGKWENNWRSFMELQNAENFAGSLKRKRTVSGVHLSKTIKNW